MNAIFAISESNTNRQPKAWPIGKRLGGAIVAVLVLFGARAARADAVTDWAAVMEESTLRADAIRAAAIMQLAVFEAVNAIVGDYEPYLGSVSAPAGASPEAAAIAAAHRVLVGLLPEQTDSLDAKRAASLAALPDGAAKTAGIAVGEAAAVAMLAKRANDGTDADVPYTPGTLPGQYRPTPPDFTPAFGAHLGQVSRSQSTARRGSACARRLRCAPRATRATTTR